MPSRSSTESSQIRMRTGCSPRWSSARRAGWSREKVPPAARDAVGDAVEAAAGESRGRRRCRRPRRAPRSCRRARADDRDPDAARLGVLGGVRQRLGDRRSRAAASAHGLHRASSRTSRWTGMCERARQRREGGVEPAVGQHGGVDAAGELPQLGDRSLGRGVRLVDQRLRPRRGPSRASAGPCRASSPPRRGGAGRRRGGRARCGCARPRRPASPRCALGRGLGPLGELGLTGGQHHLGRDRTVHQREHVDRCEADDHARGTEHDRADATGLELEPWHDPARSWPTAAAAPEPAPVDRHLQHHQCDQTDHRDDDEVQRAAQVGAIDDLHPHRVGHPDPVGARRRGIAARHVQPEQPCDAGLLEPGDPPERERDDCEQQQPEAEANRPRRRRRSCWRAPRRSPARGCRARRDGPRWPASWPSLSHSDHGRSARGRVAPGGPDRCRGIAPAVARGRSARDRQVRAGRHPRATAWPSHAAELDQPLHSVAVGRVRGEELGHPASSATSPVSAKPTFAPRGSRRSSRRRRPRGLAHGPRRWSRPRCRGWCARSGPAPPARGSRPVPARAPPGPPGAAVPTAVVDAHAQPLPGVDLEKLRRVSAGHGAASSCPGSGRPRRRTA